MRRIIRQCTITQCLHLVTACFLAFFFLPCALALTGEDHWVRGYHRSGVESSAWHPPVAAMIEFENTLIVGGDFAAAGSTSSPGVARWDGRSWHEMGLGLEAGFDAGVVCFTEHAGSLIAGGGFTRSGDTQLRGVARWNGEHWEPLGAGIAWIVTDLVSFRGDLIAVSSDLAPECGILAIDRWDGAEWTRIATGDRRPCGDPPRSQGHLAILGDQLFAPGLAAGLESPLARWDGEQWWPVPGGPRDCDLYALESLEGKIFVSAEYCDDVGLMSWDGRSWTRVGGSEPSWSGRINSIILHDGTLVLGGDFQKPLAGGAWLPGSDQRWSIVQWDGSRWQRFGGWRAGVLALASIGGTLYAGGEFDRIGNVPFHHLAQWTGTDWRPVGTGNGFESSDRYHKSEVRAFVDYGGELAAAGFFARAGSAAAACIALWSGDAWQPLSIGIGGTVNALAVHAGELVAGGLFDTAGDVAAENVAAWDGTRWRNLGPGLTQVTCLAVHNDTLLAGVNGGVKRWDGSRWQWLSLQGMSEPTNLVSHQGNLYVTAHSSSRPETVARWNGRSWVQMNGISGVIDLIPFADGVLASTYNGVFYWDGRAWTRWDPGSSERFDTLLQHEGALFGVTPTSCVMYWDGSMWRSAGSGLDGRVETLASVAGRLVLGGDFTHAGGIPSASIAFWKGSAPPVVVPLAARAPVGDAAPNPATVSRSMLRSATVNGVDVRIEFDLAPGGAPALFRFYDVRGRLVRTLASDASAAGGGTFVWDRRDASNRTIPRGIYFLQMRSADGVVETRRLSLLQ